MDAVADAGLELQSIDEATCLALLRREELGRLAVVHDGQPEIFPVNYRLAGKVIVIRTQPGIKLTSASLAHVAFEVEGIDPTSHEGWVVVAKGLGEDVTKSIDRWSEQLRTVDVQPWVAGRRENYLVISHVELSGRRLRRMPSHMPSGAGRGESVTKTAAEHP